eukprot:Seg5557.1 transcript_id=Seg5557.1/GoldUCD/mRNA.D3Y31 product="Thyrotroph embryonic factor" protein_id=Seg5557.1/GoldUCD/D3Y31
MSCLRTQSSVLQSKIKTDFYELDADESNAPGKSWYSWRYKETLEGLEICRYRFGLEHAFQRYHGEREQIATVHCSKSCNMKFCDGGQTANSESISGLNLDPHEQMHLSDKENSSNTSMRDANDGKFNDGKFNDGKFNIANAAYRQANWSKMKDGQPNGSQYSGVSVNSVPVIVHGSAKQVMSNENMRNGCFVYNPMPIRRKSSKNHVPYENKDTQYWTQRIKNNVAARRSRESRRRKEIEVMKRYKSLCDENEALRKENMHLQHKVLSLENLMFAVKKDLSQEAIYRK